MILKRRLFKPDVVTSGFTLLELLVVVILVGIIAAIAAPSWLGYVNRQRLNRASGDLAQVLQQAQSDAQQKNAQRVVRINNNMTVEVSTDPSVTGITTAIGGEQTAGLQLSGSASSVTFDYRGTASDAPLVFSVTSEQLNADSQRCVVVATLLGNIVQAEGTQCDPNQWIN